MRNYLLCCHSPPFICLIFYPSPAFPPFPSPTQPSVLLGEDPPPYSPLTDPERGSAPEINCRVCQRIISVEGKIHQHVVKCGVCNEATVCSMYTHIPRSSGETSQMRKRWKLCVCTYLVISNTVIEAHGNLLLPTETFPSQIPALSHDPASFGEWASSTVVTAFTSPDINTSIVNHQHSQKQLFCSDPVEAYFRTSDLLPHCGCGVTRRCSSVWADKGRCNPDVSAINKWTWKRTPLFVQALKCIETCMNVSLLCIMVISGSIQLIIVNSFHNYVPPDPVDLHMWTNSCFFW